MTQKKDYFRYRRCINAYVYFPDWSFAGFLPLPSMRPPDRGCRVTFRRWYPQDYWPENKPPNSNWEPETINATVIECGLDGVQQQIYIQVEPIAKVNNQNKQEKKPQTYD